MKAHLSDTQITILFQHLKVLQQPAVDDEEYFCLLSVCEELRPAILSWSEGEWGRNLLCSWAA